MLLQEFAFLCTLQQEGYFQQKKKKHKQCNTVMLYLTELSNHKKKTKPKPKQPQLAQEFKVIQQPAALQ